MSGAALIEDSIHAALYMSPWTRLAAFVWGALWGSFANVLIHRIPRGEGFVRSRSACPQCSKPIAAYDNIPVVSYLVLRGQCRRCAAPIPLRYLVVELLGGILSFALFMKFVHLPLASGADPSIAAWLIWFTYGLGLLVVTYIDLDFWIIPGAIVFPMAIVGFALSILVPGLLGIGALEAFIAAGAGYGLFAGIRWIYLRWRGIEALGLGDANLLVMVGAMTGLRGLVWTIAAGALQGLLVSVPLLWLGRSVANSDLKEIHGDDPELGDEDEGRVMGQRVPFGPFLALAAMEYVLLRELIEDGIGAWLGV